MQDQRIYEYAVIRLVPRVDREEFINIGVVLYVAGQRFLQLKYALDGSRLSALFPDIDLNDVKCYMHSFDKICSGDKTAGSLALLPAGQRFRWLTATRSTIIQTSKVHSGLCTEPILKLEQLFDSMVK